MGFRPAQSGATQQLVPGRPATFHGGEYQTGTIAPAGVKMLALHLGKRSIPLDSRAEPVLLTPVSAYHAAEGIPGR